MKILSVVGARPQFIKLGPLSRELRKNHEEIIIHTGQHYDHEMSDLFFEQLEIPKPNVNLAIGSGRHGTQTGQMLAGIEKEIIRHQPDMVLSFGDTNSTLAACLDRKSTRLNSSHVATSYAVFCLKKKKNSVHKYGQGYGFNPENMSFNFEEFLEARSE